jgi:phosphoribosylglycinamide formyltransferase-1
MRISPAVIAHTTIGTSRMRASVMRLGMLNLRPGSARPRAARLGGGALVIDFQYIRDPAIAQSAIRKYPKHMPKKRVAVLISGRGSNMIALIEAAKDPLYPAAIIVAISNRPDAAGLERARMEGIATVVVDHTAFGKDREAFERALQAVLDDYRIDIVCLAGFMRLLTPWFVGRWQGRLLNIHPALLPAFKGLNTHERALAAGASVHGATVHLVVPEMDSGPILLQESIRVLETDSAETLAARVLELEHRIYPKALAMVAEQMTEVREQRTEDG